MTYYAIVYHVPKYCGIKRPRTTHYVTNGPPMLGYPRGWHLWAPLLRLMRTNPMALCDSFLMLIDPFIHRNDRHVAVTLEHFVGCLAFYFSVHGAMFGLYQDTHDGLVSQTIEILASTATKLTLRIDWLRARCLYRPQNVD